MAKQRIEYLSVDRLDIERTLVKSGAEVDLSGATDEKAKVSSNDTTAGYLNGKLVAGANVTLTENNNGGNETLTIAANFTDADDKVKVSAGDTTPAFLDTKLVAGSNVTLTKGNAGGNETLTISATAPVTSVNGLTGPVTLTAASVGAAATSHTHAASDVTSGVFETARLASSGTASASTYLRGDQTWATIAAGGGLTGTNYVYVAADGTPAQNFTALVNAYNTAKTKSPSANNVITVIAAPGLYNFGSTTLVLDTAYINLVSLDGQRSIRLDTNNGSLAAISVTANNVLVVGVDTVVSQNSRFDISTNLNNLTVINCRSFNAWNALIVSGTFIDCTSTTGRSWGSTAGGTDVSGTFIRCEVLGGQAFAGEFYSNSVASGLFIDCRCSGASGTFGGVLGTASGTFDRCTIPYNSCGGSSSGTTNGATGVFQTCVATGDTWNKINGGRLFWCRKTSGTFGTVAVSGRTYYCVDGNGAVNNQ